MFCAVKVQFILCINDSIVVGIHHLEEELRLAIGDRLVGDFLDRLLELPLQSQR